MDRTVEADAVDGCVGTDVGLERCVVLSSIDRLGQVGEFDF